MNLFSDLTTSSKQVQTRPPPLVSLATGNEDVYHYIDPQWNDRAGKILRGAICNLIQQDPRDGNYDASDAEVEWGIKVVAMSYVAGDSNRAATSLGLITGVRIRLVRITANNLDDVLQDLPTLRRWLTLRAAQVEDYSSRANTHSIFAQVVLSTLKETRADYFDTWRDMKSNALDSIVRCQYPAVLENNVHTQIFRICEDSPTLKPLFVQIVCAAKQQSLTQINTEHGVLTFLHTLMSNNRQAVPALTLRYLTKINSAVLLTQELRGELTALQEFRDKMAEDWSKAPFRSYVSSGAALFPPIKYIRLLSFISGMMSELAPDDPIKNFKFKKDETWFDIGVAAATRSDAPQYPPEGANPGQITALTSKAAQFVKAIRLGREDEFDEDDVLLTRFV